MTTALLTRLSDAMPTLVEQRAGAANRYRAASKTQTPAGATNAGDDIAGASSAAVEITLSPRARAALEKLQAASETVAAVEARGKEGQSRLDEYMSNLKELHEIELGLRKRERAESLLPSLKGLYDKLRKTEPKPAVELTGAEKEAARQLAGKLGHEPWGDNYTFGHEGMIYSFRSDGTVWVNEGDVPTSAEAKRQILSGMSERISEMSADVLFDVEAATERRDALLARQAEIRSSWTASTEA